MGLSWGRKKRKTNKHQLGARDESRDTNKKGQRLKTEEVPDNNNISC